MLKKSGAVACALFADVCAIWRGLCGRETRGRRWCEKCAEKKTVGKGEMK